MLIWYPECLFDSNLCKVVKIILPPFFLFINQYLLLGYKEIRIIS